MEKQRLTLSCAAKVEKVKKTNMTQVEFMQARLYGREVTFSVMHPSRFKEPCTEAEKCGVDSPLDKARHVLLYNMRLRDDK